jgi:TIR domain
MSDLMWDVFVLHVNEDIAVADAYANRLTAAGFTVWLDDQTRVQSAESLQKAIDDRLTQSRCGIVIISPAFLKYCPPNRCDVLFSHHPNGSHTIFPIWHEVTEAELGGWTPLSKKGLFTTDGLDQVVQSLVASLHALPAGPNSELRFLDSLYADPVSAKTFVESRLEEGIDARVIWPPEFEEMLERVQTLIARAREHHKVESCFHKDPAEGVINFLESATSAVRVAQNIKRNAPTQVLALIAGMSGYWHDMTFLIERSLANFLTLANFEAQYQLAYCFRYKTVADQMPPQWLRWFEPSRNGLRLYAELFGIEDEMSNARIYSISDVYINLYIWGPRWMVMEAARIKDNSPVPNPWFVKYLIPQVELARMSNPAFPPIKYRETALISKVLGENSEELY